MMCGYPRDHYMNTGNVHSPLYVYCADALERDGLCPDCLLRTEDEDGNRSCGFAKGDNAVAVCPYLEFDPASKGRRTRRRKKVRA